MKNVSLFLVTLVLLASCSSNELSKTSALEIINKEKGYPKPYTYDLYLIDQVTADKLEALGFEKAGLMNFSKSVTMATAGKQKTFFTEEGAKFVVGEIHKESSGVPTAVKLATMKVSEITDIRKVDDQHAVVSYRVTYDSITPFKPLVKRDLNDPADIREENFYLKDGQWTMESKR